MENYFHIGAYARCVEAASECDDVDDIDEVFREARELIFAGNGTGRGLRYV